MNELRYNLEYKTTGSQHLFDAGWIHLVFIFKNHIVRDRFNLSRFSDESRPHIKLWLDATFPQSYHVGKNHHYYGFRNSSDALLFTLTFKGLTDYQIQNPMLNSA